MGWLFMSEMRTKSQLIAHLTRETESLRTLTKCVKGSTLWVIHELKNPPATGRGGRFIACYMLGADKGWWGYKDMDESSGPYQNSCPVAYFDLVPDPGGYATEFRARCRAAQEIKAQASKALRVGAVVKLKAGLSIAGEPVTEATIESVRPLIGRVLVNGLFPRSVSIKRAWLA